MSQAKFDHQQAFGRAVGLISAEELNLLRTKRVALPGLGGVGGAHLETLARLGVGSFHLADFDSFELVNFSRQLGANTSTIGRSKVDVTAETLTRINPNATYKTFPSGISESTIDDFLQGVDVVVDGLEFFAISIRRMLYREARARKIPVVNAGPIGYGAAVLVFTPGSISFDEYFGLDDKMTRAEQLIAFGLGLSPTLISDVDPSKVDFAGETGPALVSACMFCAGAAATEVLKLICGRGRVAVAPKGIYYDPYRCRTKRLSPRPSLRRTLRGRVIREMSFRRFPALRAMHERELAEGTTTGEEDFAPQRQTTAF